MSGQSFFSHASKHSGRCHPRMGGQACHASRRRHSLVVCMDREVKTTLRFRALHSISHVALHTYPREALMQSLPQGIHGPYKLY